MGFQIMQSVFLDDNKWNEFKTVFESWIGTPYRHLTMVKGRGADCTLFIAACLYEAGYLTDVTFDYYSKDWYLFSKEELVMESYIKCTKENLREDYSTILFDNTVELIRGDILVFSFARSGVKNHTAIYTGDNKIIQSINSGRKVIDYLKLMKFFRNKMTNVIRIVKA